MSGTRLRNPAVGPQVRQSGGTRLDRGARWPYALGVALTLTAGLAAATQYYAAQFRYPPQLGPHWQHVYTPWAILAWARQWPQYQPIALQAGSLGMTVAAGGLLLLMVIQRLALSRDPANAYLHGSARWAEREDIRRAGLLDQGVGVYVGAWLDRRGRPRYLRHNGPEHVLAVAPTRSGKGVGLVVPTLLSWPASAVITDLKGELWALTAGWRQQHARNRVIRFEPAASGGVARWNCLDEIRLGTPQEIGDVQNLATLIVDPDGQGLDSHWQKTSQALLVGVILHALYKAQAGGPRATLPLIDELLADPARPVKELWEEMLTYGHRGGAPHPVVAAAARDMLDRPIEEAGSVLSTAKSYLSLYRDSAVAENVGASDFRIRDLMNHGDPVSLYIVTQPNDKARLRPLVRILVNMTVRLLADQLDFENGHPKPRYRHRLLLMLDEFPSLGRLEIMQESLAFIAGYGIKAYLITQDLSQLHAAYGKNESITANCHVQTAYPPNRLETAEYLSRLTGQTTIVTEQITVSGKRAGLFADNMSKVLHPVQRPLLTPDEAMRMPGPRKDSSGLIQEAGDMLIYVSGFPAIYGRQPLYFQDPIFGKRAAIPAPDTTDRIPRSPP